MSGFVAWWGAPVEDEPLRAALARISHRGPDGEGWARDPAGRWSVGHRRLAIADLAGGAQPIVAPGGPVLVANGEVYDHGALRAKLARGHAFTSSSGAETILALLRAHGPGVIRELEGAFAFAFIDAPARPGQEARLVVARDPIGIKPLYLGRRGDALLLASEVAALAGLARDVRELPPGHVLDTAVDLEPRAFRAIPEGVAGDEAEGSAASLAAWLRATLEVAVVSRLRADVPVGAFLSGGLASSLIAALARRHVRELHTFSVGTSGSPDLLAARRVAGYLGTVHHEHVLEPGEVKDALPRIVARLESHDQDLVRAAVPCWFLARRASLHIRAVLTGDGADELFGGVGAAAAPRRALLGRLHRTELQRVDRMTMAHGVEARVPFLDLRLVELGLRLREELLRGGDPDGRPADRWLLRRVADELLPPDIAWRPRARLDVGAGVGELASALEPRGVEALRAEEHRARHPEAALRSLEEARYHALLCLSSVDPAALLALVARSTPA